MIETLSFLFGNMKGDRRVHLLAHSLYHQPQPVCTSKNSPLTIGAKLTALDVDCQRCMQTGVFKRLFDEEMNRRERKAEWEARLARIRAKTEERAETHPGLERSDLRVAFVAFKKMRFAFPGLVIRVESLRKKYPKGLKGFLKRYRAWCNKKIVVSSGLSDLALRQAISDLEANGLLSGADFAHLDATPSALPAIEVQEISVEAPWLKVHFGVWDLFVQYAA